MPAEIRVGKIALHPPSYTLGGGRAGKAHQATHLPASQAAGLLLTGSSKSHRGPEAQASAAGEAVSSTPSLSQKERQVGEG